MAEPKTVEFYAPTHRFSASGFTVAVIAGATAGLALGFAYGTVRVLLPILYLSFLVTVLFSTVLGHAAFFCAKLGRIRNRGVATVVCVVAGLAGLYGAWVADRYVRLKMLHVEQLDLSFSPVELVRYLEYFLDNGLWQVRGNNIFGLPLLFIWLVEAGIVFALSVKAVRALSGTASYCEPCRRWTRSSRGVRTLAPNSSHGLTQELNKGNLQAIHQAMPTPPGAPLSLRVDLDQCPGCTGSVFLSM